MSQVVIEIMPYGVAGPVEGAKKENESEPEQDQQPLVRLTGELGNEDRIE